jgi:hypothetical protein
MNNLDTSTGCWLLWAQTPFESMGRHFRGETAKLYVDDLVIAALVIAGVVVAACILTWLFSGSERVHRINSPRALFRKLCRAHGLGFRDRRLLAQLARYHRLDHPARLFIESGRFEPDALSPRLRRHADSLGALRETLFAEPPGAAAVSTLAGYAAGIDLPAEAAPAAR